MTIDKYSGERKYRIGKRYRIHGYNSKGQYRILRWEDVETKRIEYVINFGYKGKGRNRSMSWEVRITGDDDMTYEDAVKHGENLLASEGFNWNYILSLDAQKVAPDTVDDKRVGVYGKAMSGHYLYPAYGEKRLDDVWSE